VGAIVVSTEVERPAAEVFAYATDPTHFSEWQRGVVRGHMDQPDPSVTPAVGTRCLTIRRIGGTDRAVTSEVTHVDPPRAWGSVASTDPSGPPLRSTSNPWPRRGRA
jgi:uncharacterized protein YndB with AHSA1/START domain